LIFSNLFVKVFSGKEGRNMNKELFDYFSIEREKSSLKIGS